MSCGTLNPLRFTVVKWVGVGTVTLVAPTALYCCTVLVSVPSTLLSMLLSTTISLNSILNSITWLLACLAFTVYRFPAYIPLYDPDPVFIKTV